MVHVFIKNSALRLQLIGPGLRSCLFRPTSHFVIAIGICLKHLFAFAPGFNWSFFFLSSIRITKDGGRLKVALPLLFYNRNLRLLIGCLRGGAKRAGFVNTLGPRSFIFYESPYRLTKAFSLIANIDQIVDISKIISVRTYFLHDFYILCSLVYLYDLLQPVFRSATWRLAVLTHLDRKRR